MATSTDPNKSGVCIVCMESYTQALGRKNSQKFYAIVSVVLFVRLVSSVLADKQYYLFSKRLLHLNSYKPFQSDNATPILEGTYYQHGDYACGPH